MDDTGSGDDSSGGTRTNPNQDESDSHNTRSIIELEEESELKSGCRSGDESE